MEPINTVLTFFIKLGSIALCGFCVASGVLRWLAVEDKRRKRLNIMAWIAFALLAVGLLFRFAGNFSAMEADAANIFDTAFNASNALVRFLIFGIAVSSIAVLAGIIFVYIFTSMQIIIRAKGKKAGCRSETNGVAFSETNGKASSQTDNKAFKSENEPSEFDKAIKSRPVIFVIALGIVSLFFILPFFWGDPGPDSSLSPWMYGAQQIGSIISTEDKEANNTNDNQNTAPGNTTNDNQPGNATLSNTTNETGANAAGTGNQTGATNDKLEIIIKYLLVYIIVWGLCYAVVRVIFSIVERLFERKRKNDLINAYASPIGFLAVGISFLWALVPHPDFSSVIEKLTQSFFTVIIIITIVIFTLEITRLLLDLQEKFLRQEARYLFVFLVGQCAFFLMHVIATICNALNSAMGDIAGSSISDIEKKVKDKMADMMENQLDTETSFPEPEQPAESKQEKKIFTSFEPRITPKREESDL